MLLSIDWDAYSACAEFVFDAPIWGTPDREHDRLEAWRERVRRRGGTGWGALEADFPLLGDPQALARYAGRPAFVAWSHAHAWAWLERFPGRAVLNLDSHHDLVSFSGDPTRLRPGNWAGLALAGGLVSRYTVRYPAWHAGLAVAEGFDLARTRAELDECLPAGILERVQLERADTLPPPEEVEAVLLVQSPAWTSPAHDADFLALALTLRAEELSAPLLRHRATGS